MVKTAVQAKQVNSIGMQVGTVAVDCEGCCLSRTGKLCLVQVSSHMACLSIRDGGWPAVQQPVSFLHADVKRTVCTQP